MHGIGAKKATIRIEIRSRATTRSAACGPRTNRMKASAMLTISSASGQSAGDMNDCMAVDDHASPPTPVAPPRL